MTIVEYVLALTLTEYLLIFITALLLILVGEAKRINVHNAKSARFETYLGEKELISLSRNEALNYHEVIFLRSLLHKAL